MDAQSTKRPFLAPGNETEWATINEEKEWQEAEFARTLSIPERLEFAQKLHDQAFKFYDAVHGSRPGPGRDLPRSDLSSVVADANVSGLECVVIGDLAVIAHGYICTARDSKLLVSDDSGTDEAILRFLGRVGARRSTVDIMRSGLPPLDYETVAVDAVDVSWRDNPFRVASLRSLVGFKRLANRSQDQVDLEALERVNGKLPIDPIPSLDK